MEEIIAKGCSKVEIEKIIEQDLLEEERERRKRLLRQASRQRLPMPANKGKTWSWHRIRSNPNTGHKNQKRRTGQMTGTKLNQDGEKVKIRAYKRTKSHRARKCQAAKQKCSRGRENEPQRANNHRD